MTYEEFLSESQARHRDYIARELDRVAEGFRRWLVYKADMEALGLQPLTCTQLDARRSQLDQMAREVESTHGDTPRQRAIYEGFYCADAQEPFHQQQQLFG